MFVPPKGVQLKVWLSDDGQVIYYDYDGPYVEEYTRRAMEKLREQRDPATDIIRVSVFDVRDADYSQFSSDDVHKSVEWFANFRKLIDDYRPIIFVAIGGFNYGMVRMRSLLDVEFKSYIVSTIDEANALAKELMSASN
jgi:hypothetical protein